MAKSANARSDWSALVLALNVPLTSAADAPPSQSVRRGPAKRYVKEDYPVPELYPAGGFTLNKGLVYAFVRQESRFNPYAVSSAGAVGLMQLRPAAAARAAGDDKLSENIIPLFDGPTNLRIGQDHIAWLMERGLGGGPEAYDLLRVVAAYNAGAGTVLKTVSRAGPGADSLLIMRACPPARRANMWKRSWRPTGSIRGCSTAAAPPWTPWRGATRSSTCGWIDRARTLIRPFGLVFHPQSRSVKSKA